MPTNPTARGPEAATIIRAATVATGADLLRPGWVEVAAGTVTRTGQGEPPGEVDVDLGDVTVVPGFVDMHVHGGGSGSFTSTDRADIAAAIGLHRRHGTSAMMASLVTAAPHDLRAQVRMLAGVVEEGGLLGIHLEGPWLSPARCGAHDPSLLREPSRAEVEDLLEAGRGTIRMVTLAPELPGAGEAISALLDAGVVVAVGHTDATYAQVRAAIDAGATVATHLYNAMRPVHHREPGPVVAALEDPRVTVELIMDGIHVDPALHRAALAQVGPGRIALVSDATAAAGMGDGDYALGSLSVEVSGGVARVAGTETIAGSTATMDHVFRVVVTTAGGDPDDALRAAVLESSVTPRRALGLPGGGLVPSAAADLVVLDRGWDVRGVLSRGHWVVPPEGRVPEG